MTFRQATFAAAALLLAPVAGPLWGQPTVPAVRTATPPAINGVLDDAVWKAAVPITDFFQREPEPGAPASEKTEVYILYDDHNLYVGFRCHGDPAKIVAKEMARDISLGNDDRVQIILDTHGDRRTAYWFQVGPRGCIGDAIVSDNGAFLNKEWDGLWMAKAKILEHGWEAEFEIPFKTLGFDKASTRWGLKLIRYVIHRLEADYWPVANINTQRFQVSDAGVLEGIEGITQGVGLDISPFVVGGLDTRRGAGSTSKLDAGLDIFYQITPGLKASFTVNTDFAETEVDDRQINLTRFSLLFPEKRDFFLNGANYFQFGLETEQESPVASRIIPFFSRRMGLDANGVPVPINYGGKITGQFGDWSIGLLHMNDERTGGDQSFSVARVSRNFGSQSSIGIIGTHGNALGSETSTLAGADVKLASSAFRKNKNIALMMFALKSSTGGASGDDYAWGAQFNYPNDFLRFRIGYHDIGDDFTAGVGFVPRTGVRETYGELTVGPRPAKWGIMQVLSGISFDRFVNDRDITETQDVTLTPLKIRFNSGEEVSYLTGVHDEFLESNFRIFEGVVIPAVDHDWRSHTLQFKTKGSRTLWTEAKYRWGGFYQGERRDMMAAAYWKVAVPLFVGAKLQSSEVDLPQGSFTTRILQGSVNLLFSPEMTMNNYIQYDNATDVMGLQSRFQWIVKPGNEIILVWSSRFSEPEGRWVMTDGAARVKLKYNIRF